MRFFLIAAILAVIILTDFVAVLRGYRSSMAEADKLLDEQLLDIAHLVAGLDVGNLDPAFSLGQHLAFQVWQDDQLVASSDQVPQSRLTDRQPGFAYANFAGYRWRTYSFSDEDRARWIVVAERTDLRFVLAENVVLESIVPILIGVPVTGILVWWIVSHGLRPLHRLSTELKSRQPGDFSPLGREYSKQELDQVIESLNSFITRLGEAMERESRFAADAAHELRTPISALKIQLHNLCDEVDTDNDSYQQLRWGIDRLQHLLEQLLALHRLSPENFMTDSQELDLFQLVRKTIVARYDMIDEKQQVLELRGEQSMINGHPFALETMVGNLIDNASKYTPPGGEIRVEVSRSSDTVCLLVEDNGPGISEAEVQRIFDRFYRGGKRQEKPGCGLGLAIVRQVATLHGAKVETLPSRLGQGAAFRICFQETLK